MCSGCAGRGRLGTRVLTGGHGGGPGAAEGKGGDEGAQGGEGLSANRVVW